MTEDFEKVVVMAWDMSSDLSAAERLFPVFHARAKGNPIMTASLIYTAGRVAGIRSERARRLKNASC